MIKRIALSVLALSLIAFAQTFNPPQLIWSGPLATSTAQCVTPAAGSASICPVLSSGVVSYFAWNGTAWVDLAATTAPTTAAVLSINGKKPDATGNVSLSAVTTTTVVAPTATSTTALQ